MSGRKVLFIAAFIISVFAGGAGGAYAAAINYSADLESVTPAGAFTSKVYVTEGMQRMEMTAGGRQAVTILRADKGVVWMLMPENRLYVEMPVDLKRDLLPPFTGPDVKVEKAFLGAEAVDGHPAKKYHVDIVRNGKKENSGFVWEAEDLDGLPIRFRTEDGSTTMTWKNIRRGAAVSAFFDIPSGYKLIEMSVPATPSGGGK